MSCHFSAQDPKECQNPLEFAAFVRPGEAHQCTQHQLGGTGCPCWVPQHDMLKISMSFGSSWDIMGHPASMAHLLHQMVSGWAKESLERRAATVQGASGNRFLCPGGWFAIAMSCPPSHQKQVEQLKQKQQLLKKRRGLCQKVLARPYGGKCLVLKCKRSMSFSYL